MMHPALPGPLPALFPMIAQSRPRWLLVLLGALMIVPVGLASTLVVPLVGEMSPRAQLLTVAFAGSSLPEELLRFAVLYYVGMRWFGFQRPRDGLVFGLLVSLGFSLAENVFYAVALGWATGVLKLVLATPIHLALGATMGCLLAVAAGNPAKRRSYVGYALAAPVLAHGVYDMVLLGALGNNGADALSRLALPILCFVLVVAIAVLTAMHAGRRIRGAATA